MAKLKSDGLTLEVRFDRFEEDWISYEIEFRWKDDVIINNSILKRTGKYWIRRSYGAFLANDYKEDCLIGTIRKTLETNNPEYWEPVEPDAKIAIYPNDFFPFLESHWITIEDDDNEIKEENVQNQEKEKIKEKHPDDLFTIITMIDSYNFRNSNSYSGQGVALHLIVTREDLEKFANDLELELGNLGNSPIEAAIRYSQDDVDKTI